LAVNFSPDGQYAASASGIVTFICMLFIILVYFSIGDTSVRVWDLNTETPKHTLQGHKNWVLSVSWSPDGQTLVSGGMDNLVMVW
jgi:WD40 repeat protein